MGAVGQLCRPIPAERRTDMDIYWWIVLCIGTAFLAVIIVLVAKFFHSVFAGMVKMQHQLLEQGEKRRREAEERRKEIAARFRRGL